MELTVTPQKTNTDLLQIPDMLQGIVYEILDGKPIFYKGYQDVLSGKKNLEEIMGTSGLQSLIISCIVGFLHKSFPKEFVFLTNELGLHLDKNDNHSLDIAVYKKELLKKVNNKYVEIPPHLVFEVDTKADLSTFEHPMDYLHIKTKKLLDFGVQEVIWVFSKSKMVVVAKPEADWLIKQWDQSFKILESYDFNLKTLLDEEEIEIED
ncbi:MAG: Uma2 family endonuclease [Microscillaceae bacterium]|nr:Uma2 family endonuclease [Microscillaceae bacterium]